MVNYPAKFDTAQFNKSRFDVLNPKWEHDLWASGNYRAYTRAIAARGSAADATGKIPITRTDTVEIQGVAKEIGRPTFGHPVGQIREKDIEFTTLDGLALQDYLYDEDGVFVGDVAGESAESWETINGQRSFISRTVTLHWREGIE